MVRIVPEGSRYTVFRDGRKVGAGDLHEVTLVVQGMLAAPGTPVLVLSDASGHVVDIDPRPSAAAPPADFSPVAPPKTGRGRPKLGVVAREVTLLPRHWSWLGEQPGGASAALRRLVDQARRDNLDGDRRRGTRDTVYRAMTTLAGNLAGYEEALRALYAGDRSAFIERISAWPADVRDYVLDLAAPGWEDSPAD